MNKSVQTIVRTTVEEIVEWGAEDREAGRRMETGGVQVVATLEVARQIALLTEELRRIAKKNDEMVACVKGILLRMEARDAK